MEKKPSKKWQPGDLVLHEAAPKVHCMLMEVTEVKGGHAKAAFLHPIPLNLISRVNGLSEDWHPMALLHDPAVFLRTEEFLQTLRDRPKRQQSSVAARQ